MNVYLAGAIEHAPDGGRAWRADLGRFLAGRLGHRFYDPALDEVKSLKPEERSVFRAWKQTDLPRFQATVRKIIHYDLDRVEEADYLVCLWDEYCLPGGGTHGELTVACRRGIPVYLVAALPVASISGWILACAEAVFPGWDELRAFLLARYGKES